jgi:hypothetical protein
VQFGIEIDVAAFEEPEGMEREGVVRFPIASLDWVPPEPMLRVETYERTCREQQIISA